MGLVAVAQLGGQRGQIERAAAGRPVGRVVQAGPADHPLRAHADVVPEEPLQPAYAHAGRGGELVDPGDRRIGRGPVHRGGDQVRVALRRALTDPDHRRFVTFAVSLGIPGTEDAICRILELRGDVTMATVLLNAGHPVLRTRAEDWLTARGYAIVERFGGHRPVTWGED